MTTAGHIVVDSLVSAPFVALGAAWFYYELTTSGFAVS